MQISRKEWGFFPPVKTTFFFRPFSTRVCKSQLTRYQRWFVSWSGLSPWCCLLVTPRLCLTHCFLCRYSLDAEMELNRETANNGHWALPKIPAPAPLLLCFLSTSYSNKRVKTLCTIEKKADILWSLQGNTGCKLRPSSELG